MQIRKLTYAMAVAIVLAMYSPVFGQTESAESSRPQPSTAAVFLQRLLNEYQYEEFARNLPGAAGLTPEEALYFAGILAYRQGRFADAVKPLVSAVNTRNYSLTSYQVEDALERLGDTATKTFRYAEAVKMYDYVDQLFGARMGGLIEAVREKRAVAAALQSVPAQTVQIAGDFSLKRTGIEYPVVAGGKELFAVLDTGAAFSAITASAAEKWGVKLLENSVTFHGLGGGTFSARAGVIPVLQVGEAELQNVAVFITDDRNLVIAEAIFGYPVLSALGRLTFATDGTLTVNARSPQAGGDNETAMWAGYSFPVISVNTVPVVGKGEVTGSAQPRLFVLDTGSLSTFLTDRYLAEHRDAFTGEPTATSRLAGGGGGASAIPAYPARDLPLWFGSARVLLNGPSVLAQPHSGEAQNYFGLIGQDVLRQFSSYTIDFRTMRFSISP